MQARGSGIHWDLQNRSQYTNQPETKQRNELRERNIFRDSELLLILFENSFIHINTKMSKNTPEDKHLPKRIAEVQMDIENWINVEANENLLEWLLERQRSWNVVGKQSYMKVSKKQKASFNTLSK